MAITLDHETFGDEPAIDPQETLDRAAALLAECVELGLKTSVEELVVLNPKSVQSEGSPEFAPNPHLASAVFGNRSWMHKS